MRYTDTALRITRTLISGLILTVAMLVSCNTESNQPVDATEIDISKNNVSYWSYKGEDVLLLGGSVQDNLFQIPDLTGHLDLLISSGGNYVRNTMSSRDSGNVWAFKRLENGLYDLNQWNDEYWERFSSFLNETSKRDIIVQIEIWATFDYYRENWDVNPFNPKNNINYDSRRSKLSEVVETHPIFTENNFFRSVPSQLAIARVLWYQQLFVDKILSYSLQQDNVLYCMDNETSVTADWGKYWALYIKKQATLAGKKVHTTEMWDPWDLSHPFHAETFDNPDIYTFVDISQNNHQSADAHWNNGIAQIERLRQMGNLRPVNNVKIYGNDGGTHKTTRDAIENFVKNVLMGCASARFHRPASGQGLNETAQAVISSMRQLSGRMDFFNGSPRNDLLLARIPGSAYCRAIDGKEYAVYFPQSGSVEIDLSGFRVTPQIEWLDVLNAKWHPPADLERSAITIKTPGQGHWVALIR
ncbi:MAG: hypothetical protein ACFCUM_05595 [Bacteroidales bacterium]